MHNFISLLPFSLLSLLQLASSAPVEKLLTPPAVEVVVRDYNTLNATTWNGLPGPPLTESTDLDSSSSSINNNAAFAVKVLPEATATSTNDNATTGGTGRLIPNPLARMVASANLTSSSASRLPPDADPLATAAASGVLTLSIVNKWPSEKVHVYVTGLDPRGALVMLGQDGRYLYPTTYSTTPVEVTGDIAIPVGKPNTTLTLTLPDYISSSRVWVVDGFLQFYVVATPNGPGLVEPSAVNAADPSSQKNYGFAELSYAASYGIYADITAVDFVGLPLGIELESANSRKQSILGTPANAATTLCNSLTAQSKKDNQPWDQLCVRDSNNKLVRVLAPSNLISQRPSAFRQYFSRYINNVWTKFAQEDLIINTQTTAGNVTCRVRNNLLQCAGDNRAHTKPVAADIFGCDSGPFLVQPTDNAIHLAVIPRLCAAYNRATFFLTGGNIQPNLGPEDYYRSPRAGPNVGGPKNWYSKFVHDIEAEGRGYAFAYDDVAPSYEVDQSGLVASTTPRLLRIIVGGT